MMAPTKGSCGGAQGEEPPVLNLELSSVWKRADPGTTDGGAAGSDIATPKKVSLPVMESDIFIKKGAPPGSSVGRGV